MELKVFHVLACAETMHLDMIVAAENKEEAIKLAEDRVSELMHDCPSLAEFREAGYLAKEFDTQHKNVIDIC